SGRWAMMHRRFPSTILWLSLSCGFISLPALASWSGGFPSATPPCTAPPGQIEPTPCLGGSGGGVVALTAPPHSASEIFAQRLAPHGVELWTANGVLLATAPANQSGAAVAAPDGSGGAVVAWVDSRAGGSNPDIYAQRISSTGVTMWTASGVPVCT